MSQRWGFRDICALAFSGSIISARNSKVNNRIRMLVFLIWVINYAMVQRDGLARRWTLGFFARGVAPKAVQYFFCAEQ